LNVGENDPARAVGCVTQLFPVREIGRPEDGVNARWPEDRELKRAYRLSYPDELNVQRISEHRNQLIA